MNNIENCLQNKIANSNNKLQPTIFKAILNLFKKGFSQITARMVKEECIKIDQNTDWNQRLNAICNSMERTIECGVRIISENKPHNDFTISFDVNGNKLDITTSKKAYAKYESEKKEKPIFPSNTPHNNSKIELEELKLSNNFKVVMVCASKKNDSFFTAYPNDYFINNPLNVNEHHPDDKMENEKISWREYLINNQNDNNLLEAYMLYQRDEYRTLFRKFKNDFYILSAGWGLVNSEYKLPNYDITFSSSSKNKNAIRKNKSIYKDFNQFYDVNMVPLISPEEDIIYVGGNDYLELFYQLTENLPNRKIIYFNSKNNPKPFFGNYLYRRYFISYSTNWHYELAYKISNGIIP